MVEHAMEINALLVWLAIAMGGSLISVLVWIFRQIIAKLGKIEEAITATNKTLAAIEGDLRKDLSGLDRRVTTIETRCATTHK